MTQAQFLFLLAFSVVNVVIAATVVIMVREARRIDGGGYWNREIFKRLGRLPTERSEANRMAFYTHRITGIAIFAFLVLHIVDVSLFAVSSSLYDDVHELYGSPVMRVFECGLLFALLFHALNGLRLVAIDVWDVGAKVATRLLTGVVATTLVVALAGSIVILKPVIA
ncbi:succinate dehydrogenase cytochrome b subunit (plasmid) [Rhodococcus jostii RHA1]|uniref:Succinate dehydrogenase cytochrome b subunit n=1 Tax=Rhodococcus jostii (strain RHA1) TaxID=101510 RepID=Q0RXW6_RHOJR|nr:succinate dehydrogenase cytochrome b subunit [Rhodococcus jostii RHA1]